MYYADNSETNINNICLTFGKFDGVHKGHRAVADTLMSNKGKHTTAAVIIEVCDTNKLYTIDEKISIFSKFGFDKVEVIRQTEGTQRMAHNEFIEYMIIKKFRPQKIVIDINKKECIHILRSLSGKYGYNIEICDTPAISADEIKEALTKSDIKRANNMLGHEFSITGEVVHGKALGRTVEMPTANILPYKNKFIPAQGVYATLTETGGKIYKGITNIGTRPSIDEQKDIKIENHMFDFDGYIYGHVISIRLYDYIRSIKKLSGIEEVKNQVTKDIQVVKKIFSE